MIVGRRSTGIPRKLALASSARIIARTSARTIPQPHERARSRYEERRKAKSIITLIAQVRAVVENLKTLTNIEESKLVDIKRAEKRLDHIEQEIVSGRKELDIIGEQRKKEEENVGILKKKRDQVNAEIAQKNTAASGLNQSIIDASESITKLEMHRDDLVASINDTEKHKKRGDAERDELERALVALSSRISDEENRMDALIEDRATVLADIEIAKGNFKIFERHIESVTKKLGIQFAYKKLN